jgi:hypothetical protein
MDAGTKVERVFVCKAQVHLHRAEPIKEAWRALDNTHTVKEPFRRQKVRDIRSGGRKIIHTRALGRKIKPSDQSGRKKSRKQWDEALSLHPRQQIIRNFVTTHTGQRQGENACQNRRYATDATHTPRLMPSRQGTSVD